MRRAEEFQKAGKPEVAEYWSLESRLWDLTHRLYNYRWNQRGEPADDNHSLAETKLILSWLTDNGPRTTEPEYIQANRWFITRENIKMRKVTGRQHQDPIVSELDPDAPLRQGKGLMAEDEENERKLLKQVFAYLRIGDVKGAQQVCRDSNNPWRAASLSGIKKDVLNQNWRRMCFQLARQPQVSRYERAVYGVVCGDLDSVVPVCQSWDDQMWAHFNAIYIWKLEEVFLLGKTDGSNCDSLVKGK
jgi:nuclear pore complex protein Nup107